MVATVPEVLADLSGATGEKVRMGLPDSDLVRRTWNSVRDLRDVHGASEEAMADIAPESWRDKVFRAGEQGASGQSIADILSAHDAESTSPNKAQYRLGKLEKRVRHDRYVAALQELPEMSPPRGTGDQHGEKETRCFTKAQQRSQSGPGATAFLRARPIDSSRVIPASALVSAEGRFLGRVEVLATRCPCCGATDANTRHAHLCYRLGAQVNQRQPLVHTLFRTLKRMSIRHQVENGAPFNAERDFRMDMVIERGGLRDATAAGITETGWLLPIMRRASAATNLDRDKCPSASAAINSPPSRWKALGASERKAAT